MKLTAQAGKKDKIHILIDGVYQTTVDALYFSTCGFRDGAELTQEQAAAFLRDAHFRRAFNKGASLLSYQDRTRRQLLERLEPDFGAEAAAAAVDRLEELRLVDDARYAETFGRNCCRAGSTAKRRMRPSMRWNSTARACCWICSKRNTAANMSMKKGIAAPLQRCKGSATGTATSARPCAKHKHRITKNKEKQYADRNDFFRLSQKYMSS